MRKVISIKKAMKKHRIMTRKKSIRREQGLPNIISSCPHCKGALLPDATMQEFYDHEVFRCFACSRYFYKGEYKFIKL